MNARLAAILVVLLVVLGGGALLYQYQESSQRPANSDTLGRPLLKDLKAAEVASIRIVEPKGTLTVRQKDDRWGLPGARGLPGRWGEGTRLRSAGALAQGRPERADRGQGPRAAQPRRQRDPGGIRRRRRKAALEAHRRQEVLQARSRQPRQGARRRPIRRAARRAEDGLRRVRPPRAGHDQELGLDRPDLVQGRESEDPRGALSRGRRLPHRARRRQRRLAPRRGAARREARGD